MHIQPTYALLGGGDPFDPRLLSLSSHQTPYSHYGHNQGSYPGAGSGGKTSLKGGLGRQTRYIFSKSTSMVLTVYLWQLHRVE